MYVWKDCDVPQEMEERQMTNNWYHWDYVLQGVSQFFKSTIQSNISVLRFDLILI